MSNTAQQKATATVGLPSKGFGDAYWAFVIIFLAFAVPIWMMKG
jgi:hypothetical protein